MPLPLAGLAVAGIGASLYGAYKGSKNKFKKSNQDFSFDLANSQYNANPNMLASVNNLNSMGTQFNQQYQNMIDPNSAYNQNQIARATTDIQDAGANRFAQQQQAIAQAGGPSRLGNLLGMIGQNRDAEAIARASAGIQQQSVNQAGQFGNMAMGAYGQSGQLASQMDARQLQNTQFNAQNQNQYNQYLKTSQYNQQMANNANEFAQKQASANNWMQLGGSLLSFGMGG